MNKETHQIFLYPDGAVQEYPNTATADQPIILENTSYVDAWMFVDGWRKVTDADREASQQAKREGVLDKLRAELTSELAAHINNTACAYELPMGQRFDSIHTAVSYADELADPEVQLVGLAFRKWRSQCNKWARDNMHTLTVTTTWDEIKDQLPLLEA